MDSHSVPTTTCALKVNIKCCPDCPEKAMKKLRKHYGVDSVSYDAEKGILRITGSNSIDPMVLINKFAEWGKKADLYFFQKGEEGCNGCSSKKKIQDEGLDDSSGYDNHDDGENYDVHAAPDKHKHNNISSQHPRLEENSPPAPKESLVNNKSAKKRFFGGLFVKKEKEERKKLMEKSAATTKWHFPHISMPEYQSPRPYGGAAHHMNQYPTMMGMIPPPQGYWSMLPPQGYGSMLPPPPPPPYGSFQSRPPPRMNPMIHYTDYEDNYYNYYP